MASAWGMQGGEINLENGPELLGENKTLETEWWWSSGLVYGNMYSWFETQGSSRCSLSRNFLPHGNVNLWDICLQTSLEKSLYIKSWTCMFLLLVLNQRIYLSLCDDFDQCYIFLFQELFVLIFFAFFYWIIF